MCHHLCPMTQHKPRAMQKNKWEMTQFHPPLSAPAKKFDLFRLEMIGSHDCCRTVVVFRAGVDDQTTLLKIFGHRRTRIWRGMLNIWPIDVTWRELQVRRNRCVCISRISDDKTADDKHLVKVQRADGFERRVADRAAALPLGVFGGGAQELQVSVEDVFDAKENIAKSGSAHKRDEGLAMIGDS